MTPIVYVALPTCNVENLITKVLDKLIDNTTLPFVLSICDNASSDNTYAVMKEYLQNIKPGSALQRIYMCRFEERKPSCDCINEALKRVANHPEIQMVAKMDHDYGVPEFWDRTILHGLKKYQLLCPSVLPETPKGMQYYSQGHQPLHKSKTDLYFPMVFPYIGEQPVYHYEGIAGYCHCFTPATLKRLGGYRPLNKGAVFGSEDADWSLRCGSINEKGYIMSLEGWHWDKDNFNQHAPETVWKAKATFNKTSLNYEDWYKENYPEK